MDCMCSWAKKTRKDLDRAVRMVAGLCDFYLDDKEHVRKVRRVVRAKKQINNGPRTTVYKYGVKVPRSVKHVIELDKAIGNTMWKGEMTL
eukprot:6787436-Ditylum_brightwellii.AAC.1